MPETTPATDRDPVLAALAARTEGLQPMRRIFHAGAGLAIAGALVLLDPPWLVAVGALAALAAAAFLFDALRFAAPAVNRFFFRAFRPLVSPREALGIASSTWYVIGCLIAVAVFPRHVAVGAILVLALADALASYAGRRWGRRRFGSGTLFGSAVFVVAAWAVLLPFASPLTAGLTAAAAALGERIPWRLDDNLTIPLVTGVVLWSLLPLTG